MARFIADRVEEQAQYSLEAGQAKYVSYFKNVLYQKYKAATDLILQNEGYGDCIVM